MPEKCLIGCPHLSLRELHEWTDRIGDALKSSGRSRVAVDTVLVAPPQVLKAFRADTDAYQRLRATGARVSATCCEDYMNNRFCASQAVVTNSNKLRAFTNARMFLDDELAEIIATGRAPVRGERRRRSTKEGGGLRPLTPRPHSSSQDIFQGRPVFPARTGGEAVVSRVGFNSLACFYDAMLEEARTALCGDHDNRELFGKELTGKMLCAPRTIGSTSAGATWEFVARRGLAPKAILFAEPIDSLAAAGLAVADVWAGRRIGAVDRLGAAFLDTVENGDRVEVREDGTVVVPRADPGS
jgi:predicted aconitase with swiveling domain